MNASHIPAVSTPDFNSKWRGRLKNRTFPSSVAQATQASDGISRFILQATSKCIRERPELLLLTALILFFNAPMLLGHSWHSMMFEDQAVRNGQWWRLFTHPFVHVTWYHLLLDATAFFLLYNSLLEKKIARRLAYVAASGAGS